MFRYLDILIYDRRSTQLVFKFERRIAMMDFTRQFSQPTDSNAAAPLMLTIRQASAKTGLSYNLLKGLCEEHRIVHLKCGAKYLINYEKLVEFLNTHPVLPEFFSLKLHFLKATGESGCSFLQTYTRP